MDQPNQEISLGKDVWNVAEGYTKLKILKWMVMLDKFEMIAIYGCEEIEEQFMIPPELVATRRIEGLKRFKDTLKLLFGNVSFVISKLKKESKEEFEDLRKRLEDVETAMPLISKLETNQATTDVRIKINDTWFSPCLIILQDIKEKMNVPINDANLIFKKGSEISIEDLEKEIIFGG